MTATAVVDLNADLGEGFGDWSMGDDAAMLEVVTTANIACGGHAGDGSTMRAACRAAAARGVAITAETCPHYFTLTDDVIMSFDANTKVNPPIREAEDVAAIKEGLKDGTLDCIVTDHAPHHKDEKNVEYNLAAFGISGIETSFSLSYTYLVKAGVLTLEQLADRMSTAPARILGLEGGALAEGAVADIMLADLNAKYVIDSKEFVSKGKNTPFNGTEVYGKVCCTIVDGDVKYGA